MKNHESKYRNTTKKLYHALFELLETKNFSDITITELCATANVNRTTFYAHFNNTYELLQLAGDDFSKDFLNDFTKELTTIDESNIQMETFVNEKYIIPYLNFIKKNKSFFKTYLNNHSVFNVSKIHSFLIDKIGIPACKSKGITNVSTINYMSKFYFNGIIAIVEEWIAHNCNDDINYICNLIINCIFPKK